jgi:tRNA(Glu) U13 pseudouridine synthase TruD
MINVTYTNTPLSINKENILGLKFPLNDVLSSKDEIKIRYSDLERALKLGNLEHNKIKIVFEDADGIKQVETTVWGITDKQVILKKGVLIPVHRIHEVK